MISSRSRPPCYVSRHWRYKMDSGITPRAVLQNEKRIFLFRHQGFLFHSPQKVGKIIDSMRLWLWFMRLNKLNFEKIHFQRTSTYFHNCIHTKSCISELYVVMLLEKTLHLENVWKNWHLKTIFNTSIDNWLWTRLQTLHFSV